MTIFGCEGGIGTGKTLTLAYLMIQDIKAGKTIYTNMTMRNLPAKVMKRIHFMDAKFIETIFEKVKNEEIDMKNSGVYIQEAHNYMDCRTSASKKNRIISYWILQSRHTGEGGCDIVYDTQELTQVDRRLRRNTDYIIHPVITRARYGVMNGKRKKIPVEITCLMDGKIGHKVQRVSFAFNCKEPMEKYDTHQKVEFNA